ncbi:hypothetical protein V5799_000092 [Amblyomma americanum]|uniref:[Histone H3]-lysine(4) N-trimethyltransferase n=1 Tax=Amblyomma americanum TaxID=6943 RepID=A0AAQ4D415_AMBAM
MARLRFPGCPGQRIGRNRVTFEDNKNRLVCDPSLSAVSNLQRSYHCFYELFGPSDEDDEFEGFSARDVRKAIQKLRHYSGDASEPCHKDELIGDTVPVKPADKLTGRSNLPPDPGGGRPTDQSHVAVATKNSRLLTPKSLPERRDTRERRRVSGRHAAQRLLDRAKRGRSKALPKKENAENRNGALATRNGCFQLPAVSARSSRRIIPRKRYLEDSEEDVPQKLHVQKKRSVSSQLPAVPEGVPVEDSKDADGKLALQEDGSREEHSADRTDDSSCQLEVERGAEEGDAGARVGLFDQPLVVQGKRPWKPSLKVQLRLSEANFGSPFTFKGSRTGSQTTSSADSTRESIKRDMVSRYAEIMATREDGPSAEVPNSPPGTAPLEDKVAAKIARLLKSQWENRLGSGGSGPRRNVVLRKARLRLSQRTLKKLRQPLEESAEESVVSEVTPDVGAEEIAESPRKQRERRVPPLNGMKRVAEKRSSVASRESRCSVCQQYKRSAELSLRYGQHACRFCFRFYAAFLRKPKKFVCPKDGNCNLAQPSKCKGCLVHACWNLFDIPAPLKHRMQRHLRPPRCGDGRSRRLPRKRKLSEDKMRAESFSEMPKPVVSSPEDSQDTLISSSDSIKSTHGPRIKHVCRRAAVVLGQKRATFSPVPAGRISLSALSEEDKSRLAVHHSSQEEDSSPEVPERNRRKDDSKKRDDGGRRRDEGGRRRDHERRGGGSGGASGREHDEPPSHERSWRSKEHDHQHHGTDHQHHRDERHHHRQQSQEQADNSSARQQHESPDEGQQEQGEGKDGGRGDKVEEKKQGPEESGEVLGVPETKRRKVEEEEAGGDQSLAEQPSQLAMQVKEEDISDEQGTLTLQPRTETPDGAEEKGEPPESPMEALASKGEQEEAPADTSCTSRPLRRNARYSTPVSGFLRVRKGRCNRCAGCLAVDCGKCACCRDKKKFGGKNLLKQACLQRRCSNLSLRPGYPTPQPETGEADVSSAQNQAGSSEPPCRIKEEEEPKNPSKPKRPRRVPRPKPVQSYRPKLDKYKRLLRRKEKAKVKATARSRLTKKGKSVRKAEANCKTEMPCGDPEEECASVAGVVAAEQEAMSLGSWENSNSSSINSGVGSSSTSSSIATAGSSGMGAKEARLQAKLYAPLVPKVVDHPLSSRQLSKKSVGHGNQPLVQALLWDEYERSKIISAGFPLVSAQQFAVQAVCFLCGSAGEEELLFCTVCCEPYHWFCLDTDEVPQAGVDQECWCCPRCQACIVCGHRSSQLLRCNKCQQTYHTDCLGPGYPSKPSRKKKIWLCAKCIRCKSCGTTSSKNSSWNFDLSLCHECLVLREKGNYCPLCEKCYEDDDYESMFPSTINMTSVSCDKFEVYEVPGGTIIIPRQHYRLENCVSTLSMATGAQVAYLGSLPLVASPFVQPAAPPPLALIGGLGGQAAPVMPLALQSPGVCSQMPLVAGSGLVANTGVVAPGVASAGLVTSVTSQTSVVNSGPSSGPRSCSSSKRVPCYANAHRKMLAQKQCAKAVMMRNRILQSGRQAAKTIVAQSQTFVARKQCTKCVVLPSRTATAPPAAVVSASEATKIAPTTSCSPQVPTLASSTSLPSPLPPAPTTAPPRSVPSPEVYPEPDSSTEFLSGPGRVSPVLLPPPQPPFSPSPQESPRGAGDSGALGAESIFALLQKAAQRILQDGWPADTDPEPCPPTSSTAVLPESKEPVHSTVGALPPTLPLQEETRMSFFDRPYIVYEITSEDGFLHSSPDAHEAWRYLFEKLQDARAGANMPPLTNDDVDGFAMMGLTHKAVVYLTEQLRGADNCENYIFQYHKRNSTKLPENPSGCARLEGFRSRGHHDMFKFLASAHRSPPSYDPSNDNGDEVEVLHKSSRRLTSLDLPMAMRFRHLKNTAKEAVGVYRSNIHGRGLYCKRNIDGGEMIIEYAGEVIRAALTDKREKYYESKGIGCYMFRIDDHEVVDATMHGNAARFINHSCEPNCYSKVITVDNKKHIVIFALRSILKGEELTYDYKFPIEDIKIPCSCGSRRCRKFLN